MTTPITELPKAQTEVLRQIELSRKKLLDLSLRNRLLAFRPAKQRSLLIVDELIREVFDILVLQGKDMGFRPNSETGEQVRIGDPEDEIIDEAESIVWQLPDETVLTPRHTDRYLQTTLQPEQLQKRLHRMASDAKTFFEEQGYSILYLALGFLNWTEASTSHEVLSAPLILIPVNLKRGSIVSAFRLAWTGDEIMTNISLQEKLKEQRTELPDFKTPDEKDHVDQYITSVAQAIAPKAAWSLSAQIYLDFFSFTKFVMWKDLEHGNWPDDRKPYAHQTLHELFGQRTPSNPVNPMKEGEIDERLKARDLHHVRDADPSQICVLEAIKTGHNLVVQGPPGTGKSQTIVNAIAELLGSGKRVLFVSEKMAALNVVLDRLREAGIDRYCLPLHSKNTNRKKLMDDLHRALEYGPGPDSADLDQYQRHEKLRAELNQLARVLRTPIGSIGWTPFRLFGMVERARVHFEKAGASLPDIRIESYVDVNQDMWDSMQRHMRQLVQLMSFVWPIKENPWRGTCPELLLPGDEKPIQDTLEQCSRLTTSLQAELRALARLTGLTLPTCLISVPPSLNSADIIAQSEPNDQAVLLSASWNEPNDAALALISTIERYQNLLPKAKLLFTERSHTLVQRQDLDEFRHLSVNKLRHLNPTFWRAWSRLRRLYRENPPRGSNAVLQDLEQLVQCKETRERLQTENVTGQELFGRHWQGEKSDPTQLWRFADWIVRFRKELLNSSLSPSACRIVEQGAPRPEIVRCKARTLQLSQELTERLSLLSEQIRFDPVPLLGTDVTHAEFMELSVLLCQWRAHTDTLRTWAQYVALRDSDHPPLADKVVRAAEDGTLGSPDDVLPALEGCFANSMLRPVIMRNETLRNFAGVIHEQTIQDFAKLEREILDLNGRRLAYMLWTETPEIGNRLPRESPLWLLRHQMRLERPSMTIRNLLRVAGESVQKLKPCFMMSPLSVAQFLEPGRLTFDTVIFDEASQVRTEDALGPILRGKQVVIMGDRKQLPPTSFFDKIATGEELTEESEDFEDVAEKNESILDRADNPWGHRNSRTLTWHYRSSHESLIQLSNNRFYDNRLQVFPSAHSDDEFLGLKLVHIPHSVYDRGKSKTNRIEAECVAKAVIDHFRQHPSKTLGVGAFSASQEQAITEALELQRKLHPEFEEYFQEDRHEKFFVKNLETIQGDERDVIFVSIGYGRDANGDFKRNFGPLNFTGGERRLNVLITRAKERCVVFSNFLANELPVDDQKTPEGVRALRAFLHFAQNRDMPTISAPTGESDSDFEDAVYEFLSERGHKVHKQVGCAQYRIDLAVVHPKLPGKYAIGVECDGAMYHSSRVARERDRLRQQVLVRLGWKLHRIWSTDWYRNREETRKRLLRAVEVSILG